MTYFSFKDTEYERKYQTNITVKESKHHIEYPWLKNKYPMCNMIKIL